MAAPMPLRGDYDAKTLRRLAKWSDDADQTRRLLALAAAHDGGSRSTAAAIGGVGLQTVRDWVLHFKSDALDPAHRRLFELAPVSLDTTLSNGTEKERSS